MLAQSRPCILTTVTHTTHATEAHLATLPGHNRQISLGKRLRVSAFSMVMLCFSPELPHLASQVPNTTNCLTHSMTFLCFVLQPPRFPDVEPKLPKQAHRHAPSLQAGGIFQSHSHLTGDDATRSIAWGWATCENCVCSLHLSLSLSLAFWPLDLVCI